MPRSTEERAAPGGAAGAGPAALVVAHPGHELRVHAWAARARPLVLVLTDGSGADRPSRLASTTAVLAGLRAVPGPIYGRFTDRRMYEAILGGRHDPFIALAEEIAACLREAGVSVVAGDAAEGYNPSHDVCRLLIDAAVELMRRSGARAPDNFDFLLAGPPDACPADLRPRAVRIELDAAALDRKMAAARAYPELAGEIESAIRAHGGWIFAVECLRPAGGGLDLDPLMRETPYYERFGERRVAEGRYPRLIRYREHVAPIAAALREYVRRRG